MYQRQLGNTSINILPLVLGGNIFGWTIDEKRSFEILDAFTGAGFSMIDTANVYSRWVPGNQGGESETIIGNWMKKKNNREKVILATKGGGDMGEGVNVTYDNIIRSAEASLKRLQTDHIDLYQTHFDNEQTPVEETMRAHNDLVQQGKVRYIGTSNMSAARINESLATSLDKGYASYATLQPLYNLYDREKFENEYRDLALKNKLAVIPYYSLASGFLTGKYRSEDDLSISQRGKGIAKYLDAKGQNILAALDEVSAAHKVTPAQVAIAWLIGQPAITAAIASATSIEQLNELGKATMLSLTKAERELLTNAGGKR